MQRYQNYNKEYKPLFQNEFKNVEENSVPVDNGYVSSENPVVINQVFENTNSNLEEPPELGPIKNISEAISHQPASLDVLDPMNIIPENYDGNPVVQPSNNDALDNYDSRINFENNAEENSNINTNFDFNLEPSVPDIPISFNQEYQNDLNTLSNMEIPNVPDVSSFNFESSIPEIPSIPEVNIDQQTTDEEPALENQEQHEEDSNETNDNTEEENNKTENPEDESTEEDDEMLDIIEESPEESENETEENQPSNENNLEDKKLLREHVDEIREYVELLKQKGIDASIAEFDFEHMYQLVIKINKKG